MYLPARRFSFDILLVRAPAITRLIVEKRLFFPRLFYGPSDSDRRRLDGELREALGVNAMAGGKTCQTDKALRARVTN